jgi:xylan 1,4-beta-xylosidase
MKKYMLDVTSQTIPFEHYWELCVGSCHGTTALREDYRRQMTQISHDCGFRYVRFHGLLNDDMSVLTSNRGPMRMENNGEPYSLSFTNTDSIIDFLLSINMKPFLELGFMPEVLTNGKTRVFHYQAHTSPPDDWKAWGWLVEQFTAHCVQRYGLDEVRQWFFEIWNEPNLGGPDREMGFWGGTQEEYFKLYEYAARAVKRVDPRLKVGGPSTACNAWVPEMIEFCSTHDVPLDFISTHHYPVDVAIETLRSMRQKGTSDQEFVKQLDSTTEMWKYIPRGILTEQAKKVRAEAGALSVYYTEWGSNANKYSDGPFGAAFEAKTIMDNYGLVQGYSRWTFSDLFEEGGMPHTPFHGGFGMQTIHGVPKASYRAYQLMHKLGNVRYTAQLADGTVDGYAFRKDASNAVQILLVNHDGLAAPIREEAVELSLTGLSQVVASTIERVDETHGNAVRRWHELGDPDYPDAYLVHDLMAASAVRPEAINVEVSGGTAKLTVTLPPQSVALITLYL